MRWLALGVLLWAAATLLLRRAPSASGAGGHAVAGHASLARGHAHAAFRWLYLMTFIAGAP
jgi:hypothetical protein